MKPAIALPLQQHPYFADALGLLGRPVSFVDVQGAAPVLAMRYCGQLMTSRGPVWEGRGDSSPLQRAGLRLVNAEAPDDPLMRTAGFRCIMTAAHVAELDLTIARDLRHMAMKPKWRNAWRAAQSAQPISMSEQTYDAHCHRWILAADLAQQRIKGFRALPHTLINAYAQIRPASVRVFIGYERATPIAAMIFLLHAPVATYHIGWTSLRGRRLCAHHQMITAAADRFAARGFRRLDLGAVETDHAPGLARFKIGTGAKVRPLGGTWLRLPGRLGRQTHWKPAACPAIRGSKTT